MRAAPPLALALGSGRPERAVVAGLVATSVATGLGWALWHGVAQQAMAWWPAAWLPLLAGLAAAALAWRLCRPVQGQLVWDSRAWRLEPAGTVLSLEPAIDLGGWMLLRLAPAQGRGLWIGLSRAQVGAAHWHALRATVYSGQPAKPDAGPAA